MNHRLHKGPEFVVFEVVHSYGTHCMTGKSGLPIALNLYAIQQLPITLVTHVPEVARMLKCHLQNRAKTSCAHVLFLADGCRMSNVLSIPPLPPKLRGRSIQAFVSPARNVSTVLKHTTCLMTVLGVEIKLGSRL